MNLRSGKEVIADHIENRTVRMENSAENSINQIVMTPDMLRTLITDMTSALRISSMPASSTTADSTVTPCKNGNFSQCTSRFDGSQATDVEAFIDAIIVYKECLNISDENALKGLPMLLHGNAATWWQGIKSSTSSFDEALKALRHAFGCHKPAYQIYRELFSREQENNEKTDIFVSKCRSLLSRLPENTKLTESDQLDMVYGLLNRRIRKKLARESIKTFNDLITISRSVEAIIMESTQKLAPTISPSTQNLTTETLTQLTKKNKVQCRFCRNYGHIKEECRKLTRLREEIPSLSPSTSRTVPNQENKPALVCFGCGKLGFVRSNCPNCSYSSVSKDTLSLDFCHSSVSYEMPDRPLVRISVRDFHGIAFLDTGAKASLAGYHLTRLLLDLHIPFTSKSLQMTLADGKLRHINAQLFNVNIVIQNKTVPVTLLSIPDFVGNRTLLGVDFIISANIVLDVPHSSWYFGECPTKAYPFAKECDFKLQCPLDAVQLSSVLLRPDEGSALTESETAAVNALLEQYSTVFKPSTEPTPFAEHTIQLTDDVPIAVPPYRMSEIKKEILRKELDELLSNGTIEECESSYAAPVVLVSKKNGKMRLCVDYRKLNAITKADRYPLPRLDDLLHSARRASYMTTIDLRSGYHQVSVRVQDQDKTAFITPFGTFRYTKMPFGLRNAPSTFQRLIDRFRSGLQNISILAYLDDLIILSSSFNEHLQDLQKVFDRLNIFKLRLNREKCTFACESVRYLGHVITKSGITPDPEKIAAIRDMKPPSNIKQLLTFVQTCSWFRRFIDGFAEVSRPLTSLLKKNIRFQWGPAQQIAFERLKIFLTTSPILRQADPSLPYILKTDASAYALGAVLMQGEGPDERPVEYASRLLTASEKNYCTTEREALAVVWSVNKFRGYLEGSTILIQTDHQPLKWLMNLKSPSGRLARWALSLQPYDIRIEYTPGKTNVVADTLSRPPVTTDEEYGISSVSVSLPAVSSADMRNKQMEEAELAHIITTLEAATPNDIELKRWSDRGYMMVNGVLYRYSPDYDGENAQLVLPRSSISEILCKYHDSPIAGHCGVDRTLQRISSRYFWTGMRKSVLDYVSKCIHCQRYKATNLKPAGLLQTPVQSQRFEVLAIDLFGPLPKSSTGDKWILVAEDTASRWIELFPLKVATAEACARCLIDEIILRYGTPRRVISDNGPQFVSNIMQKVAFCMDFKQNLIPAYHPESNPAERKNRDLKTQLSVLLQENHHNWRDKLPAIRFAMNSARCESTGFTPAFLTFGRELRTPDDVYHDLRHVANQENFIPQITPYLKLIGETLRQARYKHEHQQDIYKKNMDKRRRPVSPYRVGDKVLVDVHALSNTKHNYSSKFAPRRDGPYIISKIVSPTTFEITSADNSNTVLGKYHISALTKFMGLSNRQPIRPLKKRGRPRKSAK